jgi:hypothetical protein
MDLHIFRGHDYRDFDAQVDSKKSKKRAMNLTWRCPACTKVSPPITATTELGLKAAIALHIIETHEETSAIRAVDKARMQCMNEKCELGRTTVFNFKSKTYEPRLTDFDRKWLAGCLVRWE